MKKLLPCNDTQTSNLSPLFPLFPRAPVRAIKNVCVDICIANGTEGTLIWVEFEEGTYFDKTVFLTLNAWCPAVRLFPVSYLYHYINILCQEDSKQCHATIPLEPFLSYQPQLESLNRPNRMPRITSNIAVPVRAIICINDIQNTADHIEWIHRFSFFRGCSSRPPRARMYVVLSRVRNLESLYLFEKITE